MNLNVAQRRITMTIWHIVIAVGAFACWIYETVSHDIQELQRCRKND